MFLPGNCHGRRLVGIQLWIGADLPVQDIVVVMAANEPNPPSA